MRAAVPNSDGGLVGDRREVARLGARRVVGVTQLLDLALAQPPDRARQQTGDLGAERGGDLGRPRQQEVAGEDRLQVAPLGVHRLDTATHVGVVDHVVVVQRAEVHQLAGDAAAHHVVAHRCGAHRRGHDADHRAQALAAGHHEVRGELGEVRVGRLHRVEHRRLDARPVGVHRSQGEERRALVTPGRRTRRCGRVGHPPQAIRADRAEPRGSDDALAGRNRPPAPRGYRYTDVPSSPEKGRQCSNASLTEPAESSFSPRKRRVCSITRTSAPSTSCSG